jgi:hypothetical protein
MRHENALIFLKWCDRYPWVKSYNKKIDLDFDHKVCLTDPGVWTYMFRNRAAREMFKGIIGEAS